MSSRQEEKAARRAEREAREAAEQAKAQRTRRLQMVAGAVLAVAAIAAVVVAIAGGGGDDGGGTGGDAQEASAEVAIPARKINDLDQAAKAAGCVVKSFESEGRQHSEDEFTGYKTNPPTSGTHNPVAAEDGVYDAGSEPAVNNWVHALEHGRIIYQYKPGTPKRRIQQIETLVNEEFRGSPGYHVLAMQNTTKMPYAVAAVAWTRFLGCEKFTDASFDAMRAFRDRFVDKGPEFIP